MFRRKKSQEPEPVRQISISAPRTLSAVPPPPASPSAPLYERFARTNPPPADTNAYGRDARRIASGSSVPSTSNGHAPSTGMRPRVPSTSGGGGSARPKQIPPKPLPTLGDREDESRARTNVQQLSPPSSPTTSRQPSTSTQDYPSTPSKIMIGRRMPDSLDDVPPPARLPSVKMAKPIEPKMTRLPTPPSPPLPARAELAPAPTPPTKIGAPVSNANPPTSYPSPLSPSASDESGALSPSPAEVARRPTLGNSLEARAVHRQKYSPLAAFGSANEPVLPAPPQQAQAQAVQAQAPPPSKTPPPPPLPPKSSSRLPNVPKKPILDASSAIDVLSAETGRRRSTLVSPDLHPSSSVDNEYAANANIVGPSAFRRQNRLSTAMTRSEDEDDRRASIEPLKTASVELRVGLGVDEFHSPLFASSEMGTSAKTGEGRDRHGGMPIEPQLPSSTHSDRTLLQHVADDKRDHQRNARSNGGVVIGNENGKAAATSEPQVRRAHKGHEINGAKGVVADGNSSRTEMNTVESSRMRERIKLNADQLKPSMAMAAAAVLPPTPPSPAFHAHARKIHDEPARAPALMPVDDSHWHTQQQPIVGDKQIPTPPTSIDGHGQTGVSDTTISSILEGEESFDFSRSMNGREQRTESEMNGRKLEKDDFLSASTSSAYSAKKDVPQPRVQTDNLFYVAPSPLSAHPHEAATKTMHGAPMSPPHSPPQLQSVPSISSISSHSQSDAKKRSKSRSKSRSRPDTGGSRPGTASSAISTGSNYVPPSSASSSDGLGNGRSPSALAAIRPFANSPSPSSPGSPGPRKLHKHRPTTPKSAQHFDTGFDLEARLDAGSKTPRANAGNELLVDEDPFAKDTISTPITPPAPPFASSQYAHGGSSPGSSVPSSPAAAEDYFSSRSRRRGEKLDTKSREAALKTSMPEPDHPELNGHGANHVNGNGTEVQAEVEEAQEQEPEEPAEPTFYPLMKHLMETSMLEGLLPYLSMRDWNALMASNDAMRRAVEHKRDLRELVLERYLGIVGYERWRWPTKEHIMLTFRDLNSYMRGVSLPTHQFQVYSKALLDAKAQTQKQPGDDYLKFNLKSATAQKSLLASSCRAYTRVVLRLRSQAECVERDIEQEGPATVYQYTPPQSTTSVNTRPGVQGMPPSRRSASRVRDPSRPGSPTGSAFSHPQSAFSHGRYASSNGGHGQVYGHPNASSTRVNRYQQPDHSPASVLASRFRSPLYKPGHAPLLRVCIPSPEGAWLSDASVVECEKELKRAGVQLLLRVGDVIWDAAVGDEGNVGRLVWDGSYLIDLDYTYSRAGDAPQYLHTLSFPPSYFHRVIRTNGNPICYMDISPWGEEIAANLQLLQDRIKTETPQGGHHTVVRWIHRSRFRVRPNPYNGSAPGIPDTSLSIDPGWFGTVIIEIEGTNEGLADLQQRCKGVGFPVRAHGGGPGAMAMGKEQARQARVYRLLRERSRPGEIWVRAVREKERLM